MALLISSFLPLFLAHNLMLNLIQYPFVNAISGKPLALSETEFRNPYAISILYVQFFAHTVFNVVVDDEV